MVRLFGRNHGRSLFSRGSNDDNNHNNNSDNNNNDDDDVHHHDPTTNYNKKLRLSPSAALEYNNNHNNNNNNRNDNNDNGVTPSAYIRNRHAMQQQQQQQVSLSSPMYEYALDEYAQAVVPGTSNDDGTSIHLQQQQQLRLQLPLQLPLTDNTVSTTSATTATTGTNTNHTTTTTTTSQSSSSSGGMILQQQQQQQEEEAPSTKVQQHTGARPLQGDSSTGTLRMNTEGTYNNNNIDIPLHSQLHEQYHHYHPQNQPHQPHPQYHQHHVTTAVSLSSSSSSSMSESAFTSNAAATRNSTYEPIYDDLQSNPYTTTTTTTATRHGTKNNTGMYDNSINDSNNNNNSTSSSHNIRSAFEKDMPDATYEEIYGPAYIGGTIKYIYPVGYQSMRPRSCPWKLSIAVCLLFTWLSIFIVGHCSDQAEKSMATTAAEVAMANNAQNGIIITDDALVMEIRWCGSRLLYMMWVTSMMVTGISAAYCSVIGYIKVRDFTVANSRSQPPGVTEGKSDYYVRIRDHDVTTVRRQEDMINGFASSTMTMIRRNSNVTTTDNSSSISYYQPTIYQADGTPQFWGSHIYRPTQAAVAVTSR